MSQDVRRALLEALSEVAPEADLARLAEDVELREQLDLDSMDLLNFLVGISERTGIEIPEADAARLHTLDQLVAYLERRASSRPGVAR
jgi:acyl carrier protein